MEEYYKEFTDEITKYQYPDSFSNINTANEIGIFSSCSIFIQLLHLPVIVLLERSLNRTDGKSQIAVARFSIFRCDQRRLCDEQTAFFE